MSHLVCFSVFDMYYTVLIFTFVDYASFWGGRRRVKDLASICNSCRSTRRCSGLLFFPRYLHVGWSAGSLQEPQVTGDIAGEECAAQFLGRLCLHRFPASPHFLAPSLSRKCCETPVWPQFWLQLWS